MSMSFKYNDSELRKLQKNVEKLSGEHEVPLNALVTDGFIRQHSKFNTFQALIDASGVVNPDEFSNDKFSKFIAANTKFNGWEELLNSAAVEYAKRKLGL